MVAPGGWKSEAYGAFDQRLGLVVGAQEKAFAALGLHTVGDLMHHVPHRYVQGTDVSDLSALDVGTHVAVTARVDSVRAHPGAPGRRGRGRLEVWLTDGRHRLQATFFGANHLLEWWQRALVPGARGVFSGKVGEFRGRPQLSHPAYVIVDDAGQFVAGSDRNRSLASVFRGGPIGIYRASAKLPTWDIAEATGLTLHALGDLPDPWPSWVRQAGEVPGLIEALHAVHAPESMEEVEPGLRRLAFDEALSVQLAMAYRRADATHLSAVPREASPDGLVAALDARLPFSLTRGQQEVAAEIAADMAQPRAMQRLLQGEVGSGKTVVALRAMLSVVDSAGQAVLLAPTEVLAAQHYRTVISLLGDLHGGGGLLGGVRVELLTGSMTAAQKKKVLLAAASGEAGIVIGTHALLSDVVQFADLGLVVIDEQHRFGVEQRNALVAKSAQHPHVLVMTATPIPRSVALTIYGDLVVSTLREVPAGRAEVTTTTVEVAAQPRWVDRAWERAREEVAAGRQVFIVCPRISTAEGEAPGSGWSVEEVVERLAHTPLAQTRIGSLHGQMPTEEKEAVMSAFAAGELDVLVSTTVIEVGVDVPNASMMIICDAARFGVSQLHQLRGRIGRGQLPGLCLLLAATPAPEALERLHALAATKDGFALAEIDLEQRREGNVLGTSQTGTGTGLRLLNVTRDADLIELARDIAEQAVARDPDQDIGAFADAVRRMELASLE